MKSNLEEEGGEIRYGEVCKVGTSAVDLVITVDKGYVAKNTKNNGMNGEFGSVNLMAGNKNTFTFSFVKNGPGAELVNIESTYFTIYDIDESDGWKEEVTLTGFESWSVHTQSDLQRVIEPGKATFISTKLNIPNPANPIYLNDEQLRSSVEARFANVTQFTMTMNIPQKPGSTQPKHGRNFFFSGVSALSKSCAPMLTSK